MRAKLPILLASLILAAACSRTEQGPDPLSPTPQLGAVVNEGDLRYVAETAIMESYPVQLATMVTVENVGSRPAVVELANGCPVFLRVYRDRERTGRPAWDQAHQVFCTMAIQIVEIGPGESREFRTRSDAAQILGDSLPNGRYYLSAMVNKVGGGIELEAGEADLGR